MCPRGRPRGQGRPRGLHLWSLKVKTLSLICIGGHGTLQKYRGTGTFKLKVPR